MVKRTARWCFVLLSEVLGRFLAMRAFTLSYEQTAEQRTFRPRDTVLSYRSRVGVVTSILLGLDVHPQRSW